VTTETLPVRLKPRYTTNVVDAPISLYDGPLTLEAAGKTYTGRGSINFDWLPSPSVKWHLNDFEPAYLWPGLDDVLLRIPEFPNPVRAHVTSTSMSSNRAPTVSGYIENGEGKFCDRPLKTVTFHLANFIPFLGAPVRDLSGHASATRATLRGAGWIVTLDGIGSRSLARDHASYKISHVGRLEREGAATFSAAEAKVFLDHLYWFFSFCRGGRSPAILPVGLDEAGNEVWCEWGAWQIDRNSPARNWFNDLSAQGLEQLFPGYLLRNSDPIVRAGPACNLLVLRIRGRWKRQRTDAPASRVRVVRVDAAGGRQKLNLTEKL
jgi:hypothetical protein